MRILWLLPISPSCLDSKPPKENERDMILYLAIKFSLQFIKLYIKIVNYWSQAMPER